MFALLFELDIKAMREAVVFKIKTVVYAVFWLYNLMFKLSHGTTGMITLKNAVQWGFTAAESYHERSGGH